MIDVLKDIVLRMIEKPLNDGVQPNIVVPPAVEQAIVIPMFVSLTEADKQRAIDELITSLKPSAQSGALLANKDDVNHKAWYKEKKEHIEFNYWNRYRKYLLQKKNWALDVVNKLDDSTDTILELLEDPMEKGRSFDRRGLAFGYVQSGKTAHFTGLINKAFDAGYKLIIVLAGMHNDLRTQTQMRLDAEILGYENSVKHTAQNKENRIGVGTLPGHYILEVDSPTDRTEQGDFQSTRALTFNKQIMVVKKNKTVLEKLLKACQRSPQALYVSEEDSEGKKGYKIIHDVPILIIDDEADQASIDTSNIYDENGEILEEYDPKAINSCIRQIYKTFSQRAYLGYTATPFANVLINQDAVTEMHGQDLFPQDFIVNLPKAFNYVGPAEYFLKTDGQTGKLPLVREINYDEDFAPYSHKKTFEPVKIPNTLKKAMYSFILAIALRRHRRQEKKHNSMLIHVTRFKDVQEKIKVLVSAMRKEILEDVENGQERGEHYKGIKKHFEDEYNAQKLNTIQKMFPDQFDDHFTAEWSEIKPLILGAIKSISVMSINGNSADVLEYADYEDKGLNVIAIGGDKLSRGLTLEGLTVSYYLRASKMYDTLMQMGRWFGFRQNFLDVCRLYTTKDLVGWFQYVAEATDDLRAQLDYMAEIKAEPKEFLLRVRSHPNLLITSQNKMRSAKQMKVNYSNELIQTTVFPIEDEQFYKQNYSAARALIEQIDEQYEMNPQIDMRIAKLSSSHYFWTGVEAQPIIDFLEKYQTVASATRADSKYIGRYVKSLSEVGELTNWTVVLINTGGEEEVFTSSISLQRGIKRTGIEDKIYNHLTSLKTLISGDHVLFDFSQKMDEQAKEIKGIDEAEKKAKGTTALKIRALRKPTDALLILYPFNNEIKGVSKLAGDLTYINESKPFAFAIVTPESSSEEAEVDYVINESIVIERDAGAEYV
ncbi:Z1 domain-containing protein [Peribacillus butanolivorans]|uniref:Z1 domain-containing protein n=1 Tax=Peribacillus butanolivorans TaxID=421767 RepID=UPI00366AD1AA